MYVCIDGCGVQHVFFFFNDTATTEIYTLSLHDALPISARVRLHRQRAEGGGARNLHPVRGQGGPAAARGAGRRGAPRRARSEEHTSELQSRQYLVCRLLLEKKKQPITSSNIIDLIYIDS